MIAFIQKHFIILSLLVHFGTCIDFYMGMFKRNDFLVAQDTLYKDRTPYRFTMANYGRIFKCPITYVRVIDRLKIGKGPRVQIVRGGLRKKFIVLRITSPYNNPISVNLYVGCENKNTLTTIARPWKVIFPATKPPNTPPIVTESGVTAESSSSTTKPSSASSTTKPSSESSTTEPSSASSTTEPSSDSSTTEPSSTSLTTEPSSASSSTEPIPTSPTPKSSPT